MAKSRRRKLIQSAAYFMLCECKNHGHIVFADGSSSMEVCSIQAALMEMEDGLEAGRLLTEEVAELKRQIQHSGLSDKVNVGDVAMAMDELAEAVSREAGLHSWSPAYPPPQAPRPAREPELMPVVVVSTPSRLKEDQPPAGGLLFLLIITLK